MAATHRRCVHLLKRAQTWHYRRRIPAHLVARFSRLLVGPIVSESPKSCPRSHRQRSRRFWPTLSSASLNLSDAASLQKEQRPAQARLLPPIHMTTPSA